AARPRLRSIARTVALEGIRYGPSGRCSGRSPRILVVERRDTCLGKAIALHVALAVGGMRKFAPPDGRRARRDRRIAAGRTRRDRARCSTWRRTLDGARPARLIGRAEARVVIQRANLPHAVLFDVGHLVDALRPHRSAAEIAEHRKGAPAPFGARTA